MFGWCLYIAPICCLCSAFISPFLSLFPLPSCPFPLSLPPFLPSLLSSIPPSSFSLSFPFFLSPSSPSSSLPFIPSSLRPSPSSFPSLPPPFQAWGFSVQWSRIVAVNIATSVRGRGSRWRRVCLAPWLSIARDPHSSSYLTS